MQQLTTTGRTGWRGALLGLLAATTAAMAAVVIPACTVRLIADYDEVLVTKTVALQEHAEKLFLTLEDAAATPDPDDDLFGAHEQSYRDILVLLRVMEVRAATLPKNQITVEQVALLRDSFEKMRATHRSKSDGSPPQGLSSATLGALRIPFVQQVQSILTLQNALRR